MSFSGEKEPLITTTTKEKDKTYYGADGFPSRHITSDNASTPSSSRFLSPKTYSPSMDTIASIPTLSTTSTSSTRPFPRRSVSDSLSNIFDTKESGSVILVPSRKNPIRKIYDILFLFMVIASNFVLTVENLDQLEITPSNCTFCDDIYPKLYGGVNVTIADSEPLECKCPPRRSDGMKRVEMVIMMFFMIDWVARLLLNVITREFMAVEIDFSNCHKFAKQKPLEGKVDIRDFMLDVCATEKIERGKYARQIIKSIFSVVRTTRRGGTGPFNISIFVPLISNNGEHCNIYGKSIRKKFKKAKVEVKTLERRTSIIISDKAPSNLQLNLLIDALVIISFVAHEKMRTIHSETHYTVRLLRLFRVIQLFRFAQYGKTAPKFLDAIWDMREKLGMLVKFISLGSILIGSIVYWSEKEKWEWFDPAEGEPRWAWVRKDSKGNTIDENPFTNILDAMWWFILVVTKGTIDIHPMSPVGRFFGILTSLIGILITGFTVSAFNESWVNINEKQREVGASQVENYQGGVFTQDGISQEDKTYQSFIGTGNGVEKDFPNFQQMKNKDNNTVEGWVEKAVSSNEKSTAKDSTVALSMDFDDALSDDTPDTRFNYPTSPLKRTKLNFEDLERGVLYGETCSDLKKNRRQMILDKKAAFQIKFAEIQKTLEREFNELLKKKFNELLEEILDDE